MLISFGHGGAKNGVYGVIKELCPSLLSQMGGCYFRGHVECILGLEIKGKETVNLEKVILQSIVPRENIISI